MTRNRMSYVAQFDKQRQDRMSLESFFNQGGNFFEALDKV